MLVIGADSLIGGALVGRLERAGFPVTATTRRSEYVAPGRLFLDLNTAGIEHWAPPCPVRAAVICAAMTGIASCRDDPERSRKINVTATLALAEALVAQGIFTVYLSTNQVFDGSQAYTDARTKPTPITEYGRQKAEAEQVLQHRLANMAVVRFTKVVSPSAGILSAWAAELSMNRTVQAFEEMHFAPIPLASAVAVLELLLVHRRPGLLQVSGDQDISYAEAARIGARALGVPDTLVQPAEVPPALHPYPRHTTLNTDDLRADLGLEPPPVDWTIRTAFTAPHRLQGLR